MKIKYNECDMIEINLDNKDEVYTTGDTIKGNVTVTITDKDAVEDYEGIKNIEIRFWGRNKCIFRGDNAQTDIIASKSFEEYVDKKKRLHEGALAVGDYKWDFDFEVPKECPTSLESKYGHVRYDLRLEINYDEKPQSVLIKPVTIIDHFDLNLDEYTKNCIDCSISASRGPGNLGYTLSSPAAAYAPGQIVKFFFKIENKADQKIQYYKIGLKRKIRCQFDDPHNIKRASKVNLWELKVLDNGEENQTINQEFVLPATPPSMETKYIEVLYLLNIRCYTGTFNTIKPNFDIYVGTVPLRELLDSSFQGDKELKPSGYEKCKYLEDDFRDITTEETNRFDFFMPSYPVYKDCQIKNV